MAGDDARPELRKPARQVRDDRPVAVGGNGGTGAIAGDVSVPNPGTIRPTGDRSFGIRAQSIGGGGGVGGAIDRRDIQADGTDIRSTVNVGGGGGTGIRRGMSTSLNEG